MKMLRPLMLTLLILVATGGAAMAQFFNIKDSTLQMRLGFDIDRVWNYNQYEGSRWGLGLWMDMPLKADRQKPRMEQRLWQAEAWGGWGYIDHDWKAGASTKLRYPHGILRSVALEYRYDIESIGSRSFDSYSLFEVWGNPGYFTNRYSRVHRVGAGVMTAFRQWQLGVQYRFSRERYLFTPDSLLYPMCSASDAQNPFFQPRDLYELRLMWMRKREWTVDLMLGRQAGDASDGPIYARLLAQYSHSTKPNQGWGRLLGTEQAGATTPNAPLSRMFDLGGTYDGRIFFRNTFLTVAPNTFYTNCFVQAFVQYQTPNLWTSRLSNPRVMVQLGAMAGTELKWADCVMVEATPTYLFDGIPVQAPDKGLAELMVGIDRIIRWGVLDLGVAAACQLTPASASYHQPSFLDGCALMGVLTLIFEDN